MPRQRNKPTRAAMCKLEPEHNAMMDTLAAFQDHAYDIGYQQALDDIGERANIYAAIDKERSYQDRKYGMIHQRNLPLAIYLEICRQELNESQSALADGDKDNALLELLQVAAVAVAALEAHGLVERPNPQSPVPSP